LGRVGTGKSTLVNWLLDIVVVVVVVAAVVIVFWCRYLVNPWCSTHSTLHLQFVPLLHVGCLSST
jgi:uncharacterized protein YbaR (Trm112 family)